MGPAEPKDIQERRSLLNRLKRLTNVPKTKHKLIYDK